MRPLILLSNDDGVLAEGLAPLADALGELGEVMVIAPERERSAVSHALTLHKPLRLRPLAPNRYSLSGTPADCVYVGIVKVCPRPPALVVSGVNDGHNLGSDVFYSGTFAAAAEGALRGAPAIAVSQAPGGDFETATRVGVALAREVLAHGLPPRTVLNVNVPTDGASELQWTHLGQRVYRDQVDERHDLRGRTYFWIGGPAINAPGDARSDGEAVRRGRISVSPVRLELTARDLLEPAPAWTVGEFDIVEADG